MPRLDESWRGTRFCPQCGRSRRATNRFAPSLELAELCVRPPPLRPDGRIRYPTCTSCDRSRGGRLRVYRTARDVEGWLMDSPRESHSGFGSHGLSYMCRNSTHFKTSPSTPVLLVGREGRLPHGNGVLTPDRPVPARNNDLLQPGPRVTVIGQGVTPLQPEPDRQTGPGRPTPSREPVPARLGRGRAHGCRCRNWSAPRNGPPSTLTRSPILEWNWWGASPLYAMGYCSSPRISETSARWRT